MSDERFSRILSTVRDNGDFHALGQFAITKEELAAIEAFGVENFRRLLSAKLAEQLQASEAQPAPQSNVDVGNQG